jgi:tryptophanyl-tRNA synthetase
MLSEPVIVSAFFSFFYTFRISVSEDEKPSKKQNNTFKKFRLPYATMKVTPWEVSGKIDYEKLIKEFGVKPLEGKALHRLQERAGEHYLERRHIFFAHTNLDHVMDAIERGEKVYLYTGRAPSGPVHLGHLIPWLYAVHLQKALGATMLFQIPDEEKFLFKDNVSLADSQQWAAENILDIIACGFDPKKTKIFLDTEYAGVMYKYACMVAKKTTASKAKALFGLKQEDNVGKYFYSCMQSVPAFLPTVMEGKKTQCLIPCAIDQDVHFRLTRDVADSLGFPKPATILCRFLPSLEGGGKLSTSAGQAIFTTDDEKTVRSKINKYAFSGGKDTVDEHRKHGGNPDVDIAYQLLVFLHPDDAYVEQLGADYHAGKILSGEMKKLAADCVCEFLKGHQQRREEARKHVEHFMLRQ